MNERHHMIQFIRFEHRAGDVWFSRCNPNASVIPLIMDFFSARFNDQRFVIYDENHRLSGVYDGRRWYLVSGDAITPPPRSEDEQTMQRAWQVFYRSLTVDPRYHPELRRSFMPMRFWDNITEVKPLL
jgi:probable DNA metabolism protein